MPSVLSLSVSFPDRRFHGCADAGQPEWPPSPLRLYQALVAAAAAQNGGTLSSADSTLLRWFETLSPPEIVAPETRLAAAYRLSVPNNAMDKVAGAWNRGNLYGTGDANPATHKAMKTIRPTCLEDGDTVHYLYPVPPDPSREVLGHIERIPILARRIVALGWGTDLVIGNGRVLTEEHARQLPGIRWNPGVHSQTALRTTLPGTLEALIARHQAFLQRVNNGRFTPVAGLPVTAFQTTGYQRDDAPSQHPYAVFHLLKPGETGFRIFDARKGAEVAGMVRHAVATAAQNAGWTREQIDHFVLGHGEFRTAPGHQPVTSGRFAYIPLPTIETRKPMQTQVVTDIRRVLLTVQGTTGQQEIDSVAQTLSGNDLIDARKHEAKAWLKPQQGPDGVVQQYLTTSPTWSTVTPVVLPGHDDRDPAKIEMLLRKAVRQAGFSDTLAAHALLDWRPVGFRPGVDLASRYFVPDHLRKFRRLHVRITWCNPLGHPLPIPGPICLGGGRFYGLGLFAAERD